MPNNRQYWIKGIEKKRTSSWSGDFRRPYEEDGGFLKTCKMTCGWRLLNTVLVRYLTKGHPSFCCISRIVWHIGKQGCTGWGLLEDIWDYNDMESYVFKNSYWQGGRDHKRISWVLYFVPVSRNSGDSIISKNEKGVFTVKSYYYLISGLRIASFPSEAIWKGDAPNKVNFFVWTTALESILTCDNLMITCYNRASRCGLRCRERWPCCNIVRDGSCGICFWRSLKSNGWCQTQFLILMKCWIGGCKLRRKKKARAIAPLCLMWCSWRERNCHTIEGEIWI